MKRNGFSKRVIIGLIATPIFLLAAMFSAGMGHGSYLPLLVFYPLSFFMLILGIAADGIQDEFFKMIVGSGISLFAIGIAILQFPLYGFIIDYSKTKTEPTWFSILEILVFVHIAIAVITLPIFLISALI